MVTIRAEQRGDAEAIRRLLASSVPSVGEARLVDLLLAAGRLQIALVAEVGGDVPGAASGVVGATWSARLRG